MKNDMEYGGFSPVGLFQNKSTSVNDPLMRCVHACVMGGVCGVAYFTVMKHTATRFQSGSLNMSPTPCP